MIKEKINVGGIGITAATPEEIVAECARHIESGSTPLDVSTMSFPMMGEYERNSGYRAAIDHSDVVLPDGIMVVWLSKLTRAGIHRRLSGPDFFVELSKAAAEIAPGYFFLGSTPETLQKIEEHLGREFPAIECKGAYSPPFGEWDSAEDRRIIEAINQSGADVLWVGFTAPRQEMWVHKHKHQLNVKLIAAIGAGFDFFAGTKKRAPLWMQKAGLEWLHRVVQEPARMGRRYIKGAPRFFKLVLRHLFRPKK
jgi:N-acetylglucosaminyldiphosphoundecaprenol N-acetyl-beta-D-mannosaminyltransferase